MVNRCCTNFHFYSSRQTKWIPSGFHQLVQNLEWITPIISTLQDKQNEWSLYRVSLTVSELRKYIQSFLFFKTTKKNLFLNIQSLFQRGFFLDYLKLVLSKNGLARDLFLGQLNYYLSTSLKYIFNLGKKQSFIIFPQFWLLLFIYWIWINLNILVVKDTKFFWLPNDWLVAVGIWFGLKYKAVGRNYT